MDRDPLVDKGHTLIDLLEAEGLKIAVAIWIQNPEADAWRFWLTPEDKLDDKREFYRRIAEIIAKHRDVLPDLDASDTELISKDNPVVKSMRGLFSVKERSLVRLTNCTIDSVFIPAALILKYDFPVPAQRQK